MTYICYFVWFACDLMIDIKCLEPPVIARMQQQQQQQLTLALTHVQPNHAPLSLSCHVPAGHTRLLNLSSVN